MSLFKRILFYNSPRNVVERLERMNKIQKSFVVIALMLLVCSAYFYLQSSSLTEYGLFSEAPRHSEQLKENYYVDLKFFYLIKSLVVACLCLSHLFRFKN